MASHTPNQGSHKNWAGGEKLGVGECPECERLFQLLANVEASLTEIETRLALVAQSEPSASPAREYYSVPEFAELVCKSEYTVREWCRLHRINAEKCESGHGDSKAWKIPADELARYRDHGLLLLPTKYGRDRRTF